MAARTQVEGDPAPLTPVVFHVLLALSREPLHGYGVMKAVEVDSGLSMGPGTVYGALDRLTESGWVQASDADGGDQRRGRVFSLTDRGRTALTDEARRLTRLSHLPEVRELLPEAGG